MHVEYDFTVDGPATTAMADRPAAIRQKPWEHRGAQSAKYPANQSVAVDATTPPTPPTRSSSCVAAAGIHLAVSIFSAALTVGGLFLTYPWTSPPCAY